MNIVNETINFDLVFKKLEVIASLDQVQSLEIKEEPKVGEVEALKEAYQSEQEYINTIFMCNQAELIRMLEEEELDKGREAYKRLSLELTSKPIIKRTIM